MALGRFARCYVQVRLAHTRAKKVSVQLLKDVESIGRAGQVLQVAEGFMRNKLHPRGEAYYIVKNEPLRMPIVKAAPPKRKVQQAKEVEQVEQVETAPEVKKKPVVLEMLNLFDEKVEAQQTKPTETETKPEKEKENAKDKGWGWENEIVKDISRK